MVNGTLLQFQFLFSVVELDCWVLCVHACIKKLYLGMGPMRSVTCSTQLCYIFSRALKTSKAGFQGSSLLKVLFWVLAKKQSSKVDITANSTLSVKTKSFQEHTEDLKKKKTARIFLEVWMTSLSLGNQCNSWMHHQATCEITWHHCIPMQEAGNYFLDARFILDHNLVVEEETVSA